MVKHIILWKLKEGFSEEEKVRVKAEIKAQLEGLLGKIDGLTKMEVRTRFLDSSSADLMLDSELTDAAALAAYQTNPAHVHVADTYVRPNVQVRLSMDYEMEEEV